MREQDAARDHGVIKMGRQQQHSVEVSRSLEIPFRFLAHPATLDAALTADVRAEFRVRARHQTEGVGPRPDSLYANVEIVTDAVLV